MVRTIEKAILKITMGFIAVLLLGMSAFLVTAWVTNKNPVDFKEGDAKDEGEDVAITGNALDKASATALEYIGEGLVTETEVGDEEGYYEVEITLNNGRQVDVHLDENFKVLGQELDGENEEDEG